MSALPEKAPKTPSGLPTECRLCPRRCRANRFAGEAGLCGAADELRVARAALHFWEEPVISGTRGSGTVFFSNCPLRCTYCQNRAISQGSSGKDITVGRLIEIFLGLRAQGAHNINLVSPTHYILQVIEAIEGAKTQGLSVPIVYNTSGYEEVSSIESLAGHVDIFLSDFKYYDNRLGKRYSQVGDYRQRASEALQAMVGLVGPPVLNDDGDGLLASGVIVRHLLLPGHLEDAKAVVAFLWESYGDTIGYSLMGQYTPPASCGDAGGKPCMGDTAPAGGGMPCREVTRAEYEGLLDFADSLGITDYFWQTEGTASESFIPPFDGTGV